MRHARAWSKILAICGKKGSMTPGNSFGNWFTICEQRTAQAGLNRETIALLDQGQAVRRGTDAGDQDRHCSSTRQAHQQVQLAAHSKDCTRRTTKQTDGQRFERS